jgi:membrane-associated phospholipid phosphatase
MGRTAELLGRLAGIDEILTRPLTLPEKPRLARLAALGLAHSGDSWVWAGLLAAAWFFGDAPWKARAIVTFAGLVLIELVTVGVKMAIRRPRPVGTSGAIYRRMDPYSFPSGHAARATMLCMLSFIMGPSAAFLAIVVWSPFMVLSRIAIGIHYVFDVLVGAALGALLTLGLWLLVPLVLARI